MVVTAFSPLGQGQSYAKLGHGDISAVSDPVVANIAQRHRVTAAQVGAVTTLYASLQVLTGGSEVGSAERVHCYSQVRTGGEN